MSLFRRQLEKVRSQKAENQNREIVVAQVAQVAQAQDNSPAIPHENWDPSPTQSGPLPAQAPAQAPAQPAQHSIKEPSETLPQALIDWMLNPRTQGGDEWPIPEDLLPMVDDLVTEADALVRERDPRWRIQRGPKCLRLKAWVWDSEPPPYRPFRKTKSRFGVRR
jgi:hypothetical protein